MLILEVLLEFKSKQGNITAAFVNCEAPSDEKICIEIPMGFRKKERFFNWRYHCMASDKVSCILAVLDGKLNEVGLEQMHLMPCVAFNAYFGI